jgi:predicted PurR-regulated permease PerM
MPATEPSPRSSTAVRIIAAIVVVVALALGKEFFIPIALALCFHALLSPVVRGLERIKIPAPLGAAVVVLGSLALFVVGGWALTGPVGSWVDKAPESIATARAKLRTIGQPLDRLTDAASGVTDVPDSSAASDSSKAPAAPPPPPPPPPPPGAGPAVPSLFAQMLGKATSVISVLLAVLVLLYLMLAAGNMLFRKLVKVVPDADDKRTASDVLHQTESIVARYLLITAVINVGQGIAVGLAMWAIGMPDPLIWGLLTFVLEFIPYLGGAVNVGLLLIGGFTAFTDGKVVLPAAIYLVITTLQNNVVSPYAYGNRLKLNPLAVMICVLFWWFIWGIPGAFLAIPIAAWLKVLGDEVPRLKPLGELLGE